MTIVIKPETMTLYCEECKMYTPQGLIYATGQYSCGLCGHITENKGGKHVPET